MKHVDYGKFFFTASETSKSAAKKAAEEQCAIVKSQWEDDDRFVRVKVIQKIDHFIVDLKLTDT